MELNPELFAKCQTQPIIVFTADIDWAPTWAIQTLIDLFQCYQNPIHVFMTGSSKIIEERIPIQDRGIHPNFLSESSHGNGIAEIIQNCLQFCPTAISFRSHAFVDSSLIIPALLDQGIKYDTNICLNMQAKLFPLIHAFGHLRFPTWWEDDIHLRYHANYNIADIQPELLKAGLKVFNIHPFSLALNIQNAKFYQEQKHLYKLEMHPKWRRYRYHGEDGLLVFTQKLFQLIEKEGLEVLSLDKVYQEAIKQ